MRGHEKGVPVVIEGLGVVMDRGMCGNGVRVVMEGRGRCGNGRGACGNYDYYYCCYYYYYYCYYY